MSGVRRKLHAKRDSVSNSSAEAFVWASDRRSAADSAQSPSYEQHQNHAHACSSPNKQSSKAFSAQQPAVVGDGFKWISDYLEEDQQGSTSPANHQQQVSRQRHPPPATHSPAFSYGAAGAGLSRPVSAPHINTQPAGLHPAAGPQQAHPATDPGHRQGVGAQAARKQPVGPSVHGVRTAAGAAAAAAGGAAASAGRWLGAAAGSALDQLMGYDAALSPTAHQAVSQGVATGTQQKHQEQQVQEQAEIGQQQQQQQEQQHRYPTRRRLQATRQASSTTSSTPQQQQQQQQGPAGGSDTGSTSGWGWAVLLGLIAVVSDAATALTTAYTESLRPGAELLWHVAAALLLYLLLPLLRLLLAAAKLLLQGLGRLLQATNRLLGRVVQSAGAQHGRSPVKQQLRGGLRRGSSTMPAASKEQQQLLRQAEQQLQLINSTYPGVFDETIDFPALFSSPSSFTPGQLLDPASGYGACTYMGSSADGQPVAVQVQVLTSQKDVEWWCSAVGAIAQLQQAAAKAHGACAPTGQQPGSSPAWVKVYGAAAGTVPAAALHQCAAAVGSSATRQPSGVVAVGLVAVQLLQQPRGLLTLLSDGGFAAAASRAPGAAAAAAASEAGGPVAAADEVFALCRRVRLAAEAAHAVQQLSSLLNQQQPSSSSSAAGSAPHCTAIVPLLPHLGLSAHQLASAFVLDGAAGQQAQLLFHPASLLLGAAGPCGAAVQQQQQQLEEEGLRVLLSGVKQLQAAQASPSPSPAAAAGVSTGLSSDECIEQLEQCLRELQQQQQQQPQLQGLAASAALHSNSNSCTAALVQAFAGVLLMLLSGQQGPGALLAPGSNIIPELRSSLQQLQHHSLQHTLAEGSALSLLHGRVSGVSPQLRSRLEQLSRQVLQQVLACWEWASARAACQHASDSNSRNFTAGSAATSAGPGPSTCSPTLVLEAKQQQQQQPRTSLWGSLQWLTGRSTGSCDTRGSAGTQQQGQQLQQQQAAGESSGLDWQQLLQSLEEAGQSAAACQRLLQHQAQAPPAAYLCPISHELMSDPVVACDGHTYERHSITEWLQSCAARRVAPKSPMTGMVMQAHLVPNYNLRSLIKEWQERGS